MNTRSKTATQFYTSEHADRSVQIGLAGREVASEGVMSKEHAATACHPLTFRRLPRFALHVLRTYRGQTHVRRPSSSVRGRWQHKKPFASVAKNVPTLLLV